MKKIIMYPKEQIDTIASLLNGLTVTGTQNCKQIAVIVQILESGKTEEVKDGKKEGDV